MLPGTGTIVNSAAIIVGGIIGLIFNKKLNKNMCKTLMQSLGASVLFIGAAGVLEGLMTVTESGLSTQNALYLIACLVSGTFIGEILKIKQHTERFGAYLSEKTKSEDSGSFISSFVSASLTVCIGAMAVLGSIEDGMNGDPSTLYIKSLLDGFIIMIFASVTGKGAVFSAIPVFVFQGLITVISMFASTLFSSLVITNMSFIGSVLVFLVGINLLFDKEINVANMLPSVFTAIPLTYIFSLLIK